MSQAKRLRAFLNPLAAQVIPNKLDIFSILKFATTAGMKIDILGIMKVTRVAQEVMKEKQAANPQVTVGEILNDPRLAQVIDSLDDDGEKIETKVVRCPSCSLLQEITLRDVQPCSCGFNWEPRSQHVASGNGSSTVA